MYGEIDLFCVTFWVTLDAEKASHFVVQWTEAQREMGQNQARDCSEIFELSDTKIRCV